LNDEEHAKIGAAATLTDASASSFLRLAGLRDEQSLHRYFATLVSQLAIVERANRDLSALREALETSDEALTGAALQPVAHDLTTLETHLRTLLKPLL
jgi:hypothetical protein